MISNNIKTVILLGSLSSLVLLIGGLIGGSSGIAIALIIALLINGCMYFFSETIALKSYGAQQLDPNQYPDIYAEVQDLTNTMNIPMPRLWIIHDKMANAFATGRNPSHASVAFTTGILEVLDRQELRGVIAHELSHIKNRDTLIATMAAMLATIIGYMAYMIRWFPVSRDRKNNFLNAITLFIISLLIPIAATIIQMAISRTREYQADETGAHTCKDPLALARALEKIHRNVSYNHLSKDDLQHAGTASLFIINPFLNGNWTSLFSTHPPVALRIKRLKEIYSEIYPYTNNLR